MKLLTIDYILLLNIFILLAILYYTIKIIEKRGYLYNKESILTKICRKEHNTKLQTTCH